MTYTVLPVSFVYFSCSDLQNTFGQVELFSIIDLNSLRTTVILAAWRVHFYGLRMLHKLNSLIQIRSNCENSSTLVRFKPNLKVIHTFVSHVINHLVCWTKRNGFGTPRFWKSLVIGRKLTTVWHPPQLAFLSSTENGIPYRSTKSDWLEFRGVNASHWWNQVKTW